MTSRHDVVVVGAGPAGSAAAYFLARAGLDTLLIDKAVFPRDKTCGDGLTPRALAVLTDMGLLDSVNRLGCRIEGLELVAPAGGTTQFPVPQADGLPAHMVILPRLILDDLIRARAVEAGATFEGGAEVSQIDVEPGGVRVRAQNREVTAVHSARLAIVATGAAMKLVRRLGLAPDRPAAMLAARAYFEGLIDLPPVVEVHFDGVPLPGYGWIFPLSTSSANIGAGVIPAGFPRREKAVNSRRAFQEFTAAIQRHLEPARQVGPIQGYPIRIDFERSPTHADRILLVGEAAGLANPLTGEGIDYALESGRIAAEHASDMLSRNDFSVHQRSAYDRALRDRFQNMMAGSRRLADLYLNPFLLNRWVSAARRFSDIRDLFANITVGNRGLHEGLSVRTLLRVALSV